MRCVPHPRRPRSPRLPSSPLLALGLLAPLALGGTPAPPQDPAGEAPAPAPAEAPATLRAGLRVTKVANCGYLLEAPEGRETQRIITETMHERKKVMFMNADAVAVLPGGAGSLDEFFEVLTWAQLGLHAKPVILLDTEGYWQPLIQLIDHVISEGFADESLRALYTVAKSIDDLLDALGG